ncbi:MAG: hypothetical protein HY558_00050 [Euryarchaeota archaeon]|nr:hypothetical protein [Euryarchaeota archaeon]
MPPQPVAVNIEAEVERLKAQVEALNEARKASNDKIIAMSERMGELKTLVADLEKRMREIVHTAQKATDLVEKVQPDTLLKEIRRQDAKTEALKAKLDTYEAIFTKISDEVKENRRQMSLFRGVESLQKMSEEMRKDLATLKRIEENSKRHADRVETMFIDTQKKYSVDKMNSRMEAFEKLLKDFAKDVDKVKVDTIRAARKEDLENLAKNVMQKVEDVKGLKTLLDERKEDLKKLRTGELTQGIESLREETRSLKLHLQSQVQELQRQLQAKPPGVALRDLEELQKRLLGEVADLERRLGPLLTPPGGSPAGRGRPPRPAPAPDHRETLEKNRTEIGTTIEILKRYKDQGSISEATYHAMVNKKEQELRQIHRQLGG